MTNEELEKELYRVRRELDSTAELLDGTRQVLDATLDAQERDKKRCEFYEREASQLRWNMAELRSECSEREAAKLREQIALLNSELRFEAEEADRLFVLVKNLRTKNRNLRKKVNPKHHPDPPIPTLQVFYDQTAAAYLM